MRALTIMAAAVLAACAGQAGADGKLRISPAVASAFEAYKGWLGPTNRGFYAVTEDGQGGSGYGCPDYRCQAGPSYRTEAVKACEAANPGHRCIIFAENRDPVIEYEVAP